MIIQRGGIVLFQKKQIKFDWEKEHYTGYVEKEYENAYLVVVLNPSSDMKDKYTDRMIISKKKCHEIETKLEAL